jgi:hypothetical protein
MEDGLWPRSKTKNIKREAPVGVGEEEARWRTGVVAGVGGQRRVTLRDSCLRQSRGGGRRSYAVLKVKRGRYLNGKNSNAVTNNPADSQSTSLVIIIELPLHCKLSPHCPFMKTWLYVYEYRIYMEGATDGGRAGGWVFFNMQLSCYVCRWVVTVRLFSELVCQTDRFCVWKVLCLRVCSTVILLFYWL